MTAYPVIETTRLIIRAPDARDSAAMLSFLSEDRSEFYGGPMTPSDAWHKFAAYVGQWSLRGYGIFAITLKDTGETVGMAGPFHPDHFDEPEMSWLLTSDAHEGKGLAHEACKAVIAHLFDDHGWPNVVSYIHTDNAGSLALAKRLGAQLDDTASCPIENCVSYRHFPAEAMQ